MLHNVFDCNLLLVNLQNMFSNVNENQACRKTGVYGNKTHPREYCVGYVVYWIRKHLNLPLRELPGTCAFSVSSLILLIITFSSFILLKFSKAHCCTPTN